MCTIAPLSECSITWNALNELALTWKLCMVTGITQEIIVFIDKTQILQSLQNAWIMKNPCFNAVIAVINVYIDIH